MRETKADATIKRLIEEGWTVSHEATVSSYKFAGTVSSMKPRGGYEFCRVHHGKKVVNHSYQITTVMKRDLVRGCIE